MVDPRHMIGRTEKVRQLRETLLEKRIVYLSAFFYGGKTMLMDQLAARWTGSVVRLDAGEGGFDLPQAPDAPCLLLIDDLQSLRNGPNAERLADLLLALPEEHYALMAGRGQCPTGLNALFISGEITVLDREFMAFSPEEMAQLYLSYGLSLTPSDIEFLRDASWGWPFAQHVMARKMQSAPKLSLRTVWEDAAADLERVLMSDVVYGMPEQERYFLYSLSPFSQFSEEMARVVTGRTDAPRLLEEITDNSHILFSEKRGLYHFIPFVRKALYRELACMHSESYIQGLYRRAALYYELQNQIPVAVSYYVTLNDREKIRELLIRNSQLKPGSGDYTALRDAYAILSKEEILSSPELIKGMCVIESLLGRGDESERWYQELKNLIRRTSAKDAKKRAAEEIAAYLDIILPQRGSGHVLSTLLATAKLNRWSQSASWRGGFNMAGNSVSLLNGGLDFCRWVPHGYTLYRTLKAPIEASLGRAGSGLGELAMGECILESELNGEYGEAYSHVYRGLARIGDDLELRCVGTGIQSRILAAQGNAEEAVRLMDSLISSLPENAPARLKQNMKIHRIHLQLLRGQTQEALKWLETDAPDETGEFVILDRYGYMLKLRMYLITGRLMETQMLCAMLRQYFDSYDRPYMRVRLHLLEAMILRKMGREGWREEMSAALRTAKKYRLARVIADEGIAVIDLLHEMDLPDEKWEQGVMRLTRSQAAYYPAYLKEIVHRPLLSEREYQVYSLLLAGCSNGKIASILNITERTVKYHTSAIYEKLGVKTRAQAMNRAAELGDM